MRVHINHQLCSNVRPHRAGDCHQANPHVVGQHCQRRVQLQARRDNFAIPGVRDTRPVASTTFMICARTSAEPWRMAGNQPQKTIVMKLMVMT